MQRVSSSKDVMEKLITGILGQEYSGIYQKIQNLEWWLYCCDIKYRGKRVENTEKRRLKI